MSHFSVLVVTPTGSQEELAAALQPFHEYECTGVRDQYVVEVDETEQFHREYEKATVTVYTTPDGTKLTSADERWEGLAYREATPEELKQIGDDDSMGMAKGIVYRRLNGVIRVRDTSKLTEEEVPVKDRMTQREYAEYLHGEPDARFRVLECDGDRVVKVADITNPNNKWDWWVVGGRYANRLLVLDGEFVDSCAARLLNLEGMMARRALAARRSWKVMRDIVQAAGIDPASHQTLASLKGEGEWTAEIGEAYWKQPTVEAIRKAASSALRTGGPEREFIMIDAPSQDEMMTTDCATFMDRMKLRRNGFYAFLDLDGMWRSRGDMGWFGVSLNETDPDEFARETFKRLEELKKTDAWVTVVDCHI